MANKKSQINIDVSMDENNVPEKLTWIASDVDEKPQDTKALFLSVWDSNAKQTLKMDLWTKDMRVDEMKYFFYQTLLLMSDNLERATNEKEMADSLRDFCKYFSDKMLKS